MNDDWVANVPEEWRYEVVFDSRGSDCGEVLVDLKIFFRPLAPGSRVLICASSPVSQREFPAWCRLTGHRLLEMAFPYYLIQVKDL
jgi:TusA-related sulfurtransferase